MLKLDMELAKCKGAEVKIEADGTLCLRLILLSRSGKLIDIDEETEINTSLADIAKAGMAGPLALTFTGKGVLVKKTAAITTLTDQILNNLFPGFKPEEFYIQHFRSGEYSWVSFIRREVADLIIKAFQSAGAIVLNVSLGPFLVDHVIPQLNHYGGLLQFEGHQISLGQEGEWLDYTFNTVNTNAFELKIDREKIAGTMLLAYAAAFQLLLSDRLDLIGIEDNEMSGALSELKAEIRFKGTGTVLLIALFGILLINFILFTYYNSQNVTLAGNVGQRSNLYNDRQKLEEQVSAKELAVKKLGWNSGMRYAYLCDQVGQSVPTGISLNKLKVREADISISGISANVYLVNDWLYALKQRSWVKHIQLSRYGRDEQKESDIFTIDIKY